VDLMKGLFRLLAGDPDEAARLISDSFDRIDGDDPLQLLLAGVTAMFTRDDRTPRQLLARALARARDTRGVAPPPRLLGPVVPVALLETWEGAYAAARAHATEGERLARDTGQDHLLAHFTGVLAWIAAVRGEECAVLASQTLELAHQHRVRPSVAIGVWALA